MLSLDDGEGVLDKMLEEAVEGEPDLAAEDGHVGLEDGTGCGEVEEEGVEEAGQEDLDLLVSGGVQDANQVGMDGGLDEGGEVEVGGDEVLLEGSGVVDGSEVEDASGGSYEALQLFQ